MARENFDTSVEVPATEGRYRARNPTEARATYWWTNQDGTRRRLWNGGRSRGLVKADERLGGALRDAVAALLSRDEPARVLEIGCGYGRVLLELRAEHPHRFDLHGINVEPGYNERLLREYAIDQGLDVPDAPFPTIHVHDADKGLPFGDNEFDLVYSVATLHSIRDKLRLLEEVSRVLGPGGVGLIEFPTAVEDMVGNPVPEQYRQRIEVWRRGERVDVCEWLGSFGPISVGTAKDDRYFRVEKSDRLELPADLVVHFFLSEVCTTWWGCHSIYRCRED